MTKLVLQTPGREISATRHGRLAQVGHLLFAFGALVATSARAQPPPNILLVVSDDQSAALVGIYGDKDARTPNLDRFAREGARFERAYVSAPQCVPSRATILTGRSAVSIAMTRFTALLPREVRTFPEWLRAEARYYTGIGGRYYHLDGMRGGPTETQEAIERHGLRTFAQRVDYLPEPTPQSEALNVLNTFLDQVPKGRPFFLQLGFNDPHRGFDPKAAGDQPVDPAALTLPPFFPDTELVRKDFAGYYGEVQRLDRDFGRVLEVLDRRGLAANTLVVFIGDNGASLLRGKGTLYELGVRVPLLMRWPGTVKPGTIIAEPVSGEDIAPTLLEIGGVKVPAELTGRSLAGRLRGGAASGEERFVFSERGAHGSNLPGTTNAFDLSRVAIGRTHKLIYNALWRQPYDPVDFNGSAMWQEIRAMQKEGRLDPLFSRLYFPPERPIFELYDLGTDPHELTNLVGRPEHAEMERRLKTALQEWMILHRDYLPLPISRRSAREEE